MEQSTERFITINHYDMQQNYLLKQYGKAKKYHNKYHNKNIVRRNFKK